jgi:myo-inositol 2-dehydrogenase / D-chiro-inositol 1-dehydrogenase
LTIPPIIANVYENKGITRAIRKMRHFTTAVIGAGRMGTVHITNIMENLPRVTIGGVYDTNQSTAEKELIKKHALPLYGTEDEMWQDRSTDAVCICSPTTTHLDYIQKAARAGKHIFCEKPIGEDIVEIRETLETVSSAGVILMIGFNRRFDANFQRAAKAVRDGEIGSPHIVKITSRDPHPPSHDFIKTSGGLFFDMSIHDWDMARFLMGAEIESVFATGSNLVDPEIGKLDDIDTAAAVLRFAGGGIAVIDNSRQAVYGYDQRVEVFGSRGSIAIDNQPANTARISTAECIRQDSIPYFFIDRYMQSYSDELRAFFEAIENGAPSPVSGYDALAAVTIARAALVSHREHRPVSPDEE